MPFILVKTAGVHAKLFCDFGPNFIVVDEDGKSPWLTLLHRVEEVSNIIDRDADVEVKKLYTIHCVEGERHNASWGILCKQVQLKLAVQSDPSIVQ